MARPTVTNFRTDYPEFGSVSKFPDSAVTYWLGIAKLMLTTRWDDTPAEAGAPTQLYYGTELFVAHNLVLEAQARKNAAKGGTPGVGNAGPVSSKSVGPVSISYDTASAIELDAGHWNLTVYGTRFIQLARMMGAGPLQIGQGCAPYGSGGAWPGPWPYPLPGGSGFG